MRNVCRYHDKGHACLTKVCASSQIKNSGPEMKHRSDAILSTLKTTATRQSIAPATPAAQGNVTLLVT